MDKIIKNSFIESIYLKNALVNDDLFLSRIETIGRKITNCIKTGNKVLICGNGGSASDALHFAAEIVGRFQSEREPWPAIALNSDVATVTAIANDYGYDNIFARQVVAHAKMGDVVIGISTSGNSVNVLNAINIAKERNVLTVALLGKDGGKIGKVVDEPIIVPSSVVARVQETHILIIHILCEIIEKEMNE